MRAPKYVLNGLLGVSALVFGSARLIHAPVENGPVLTAAVTFVTRSPSSPKGLPARGAAEAVAAVTRSAVGAFTGVVRPLSRPEALEDAFRAYFAYKAAIFSVIGLTVSEVQLSTIPPLVSNTGQLLIGCALGGRFERSFLDRMPGFVAATLASILLALALAATLGAGLAWAYGLPVPSVVLATAPGGIAEMCITAKVLRLGVPLVTAAHVTRVIVLVTGTGTLFKLARAMAEKLKKS